MMFPHLTLSELALADIRSLSTLVPREKASLPSNWRLGGK